MPESNELIWFSERSGWAHLYLYDLESGACKHPITQGEWVVREELLLYDQSRREIFIQTAGRVPGRDPYYRDICRVHVETGEVTTLVSGDCDHVMWTALNTAWLPESVCGISPSGKYLVATRTRADQCPVTVLLDREGKEIAEVEQADLSQLLNWQWPEPVEMKAADGETDIYGAVFRPSDFSPAQSYPVVLTCFASVESIATPKASFPDWRFFYMHLAALAELGFIVVTIDGRGTPFRSRQFLDAHYGRYSAASYSSDRIAGLKQLAERYPYMDLSRVGSYSTTSSVHPLYDLLEHPDFFKVGIIQSSWPDSRILPAPWVEPLETGPPWNSQAEYQVDKLQGKLMIIHGMLDTVCPAAGMFRLVEALHKANKDFDMLILPKLKHELGDFANRYLIRRKWDYLVKHLLEIQPPALGRA